MNSITKYAAAFWFTLLTFYYPYSFASGETYSSDRALVPICTTMPEMTQLRKNVRGAILSNGYDSAKIIRGRVILYNSKGAIKDQSYFDAESIANDGRYGALKLGLYVGQDLELSVYWTTVSKPISSGMLKIVSGKLVRFCETDAKAR